MRTFTDATDFYSYGSHTRGTLTNLGRFGRLITTWDDPSFASLARDGLVTADEDNPRQFTLTDLGAHMVFHAEDSYRGMDSSVFGDWRTKAAAREAGDLKPEQETTVKVMRGGKVVAWVHDAEKCEIRP